MSWRLSNNPSHWSACCPKGKEVKCAKYDDDGACIWAACCGEDEYAVGQQTCSPKDVIYE